jgi:alpha-amylase
LIRSKEYSKSICQARWANRQVSLGAAVAASRHAQASLLGANLLFWLERTPTLENPTLLQAFEWNVPPDGTHWTRLLKALPQLKAIGVSNLWLPPACKASGGAEGNGYDIYDLWDLGEFDQKGSIRTKWGDKNELMQLTGKAKELGVGVYWDAVLNHKAGADRTEPVKVVEVDRYGQFCL